MEYLKKYYSFINENMDMAKSIMKKKMDSYEKLKTLLSKNVGYIGKFTEYLMNENIPYEELEKLYSELITLKQKSRNIDINELKYEKVLDKIQETKNDISIKWLLGQFPGEQKGFAKELLDHRYDSSFSNILLKVASKENVNNFISKVSRYKSSDELYNALKVFSKDAKNDKESVIQTVGGLNSNIVYNDKNIIIVLIDSHEDIKVLGSDTSWCIVGSKSTYDSYAKGRYQFVMYNYDIDEYDPKFKIGFTVNKDFTIRNAHDILDNGCIPLLKGILADKEIVLKDLLPKKEPITIDLSKLNARTSVDKLTQICDEIDSNLIPELIAKLVSFKNRSYDTIKSLVTQIVKRYFNDKQYITKEEILKLNPSLYNTNERGFRFLKDTVVNQIIDPDDVSYQTLRNIDRSLLPIWINSWTEKAILQSDGIDNYLSNYSKDILLLMSDKFNNTYKNTKLSFKDVGSRYYDSNDVDDRNKGYKFPKQFEFNMLLLNALLDRMESTPDYKHIIEHVSDNDKSQFVNELKLPVDLSTYYPTYGSKLSDIIPYVIKKDYDDTNLYLTVYNYSSFSNLLNTLSDYKVSFRITKDNLKKIRNQNSNNISLSNVLKKFKITKLVKGTIETDGNLTVKLV